MVPSVEVQSYKERCQEEFEKCLACGRFQYLETVQGMQQRARAKGQKRRDSARGSREPQLNPSHGNMGCVDGWKDG